MNPQQPISRSAAPATESAKTRLRLLQERIAELKSDLAVYLLPNVSSSEGSPSERSSLSTGLGSQT